MIEIEIEYRGTMIRGFSVSGHAGYALPGEDIYCAGVSAVTQTALMGLIKHLKQKPEYKIEQGFMWCQLPPDLDEEDREKAGIILSTMETGLMAMQKAYQGFMQVRIRRS